MTVPMTAKAEQMVTAYLPIPNTPWLRNSVNELDGYRPTQALIDEAVITYGEIYAN